MRNDVWEYILKRRAVRVADMGRDFGHTRQWAQQMLAPAVAAGFLVRGRERTYCLPEAVNVQVPLPPRASRKLSGLMRVLRAAGDWMTSRDLLAQAGVSTQVLRTAMEQGLVVRQGMNWYGLPEWPDLPPERHSNVEQFLCWMQTGPKTPTEVYAWWSGRVSQASVTLSRLKAKGLISKASGKYQLT
jgi:hypothetical protein